MSPAAQPNLGAAYPTAAPLLPPTPPTTTRPIEPTARSTHDRERRELPDPTTPRIVQLIQLSAREYAEMVARLTEPHEGAPSQSPVARDPTGPGQHIDAYA